ncbi:MAG TPA: tRNA preQ1(34) S-adenosylmethionine ribosyltransferase-isomerase QueA [Clostridiales bacterium]|nr:MAG: S-adenosylmethionine:tRNA ribosyltransferase-isomerase [Firmicutes bacterium ADurb.Bin262]HOU10535.1 tRNA preQ1(34) S-adenosylmethionine ribosyltransferase-isomerase QueA [Clostridiales bacterium]HQH62861.1 tRNA preQ1(34) S-adenosylmethionine ribosyltransferase-isomerase QueA [Clostridiales bacterium]HQK74177.1 tRNA preQ1(34) S-adenosylmethionine ribosyltransferase-isomerase QueA [Clostridiales bacterium]
MKTSDFYYELPPELIAQHPAQPRDSSRLFILDRQTGEKKHGVFSDITQYLLEGDCLILNDTRVLPARLDAVRTDTGARVELLLLNRVGADTWEVLAGPGKKAREGARFDIGGLMRAQIIDVLPDGNRVARFEWDGDFFAALEKVGEMPLPHYIKEKLRSPDEYQTVYSKTDGSAAAPTAGLHFTPELLERIKGGGVGIGFITLHVGLGTFRPVKTQRIEDHVMHAEHYAIPQETAGLIARTKQRGGRVFAVGTTCCRTLETAAGRDGTVAASEGWTDIFIYPGYRFQRVDALLTNFHLPESTLIMLVSAFCGLDNTMNAYREAVRLKYRFYSFGDAMLITDTAKRRDRG